MNCKRLPVIKDDKIVFVTLVISKKQVLAMCRIFYILPVLNSNFNSRSGGMFMVLERNLKFFK